MKKQSINSKIIILLLMGILFWPFSSSGATTQEIIQKVQKTYENAQDVSSEFSQKIVISSLEKEIEKTGKTIFKKPGKLYVEYDGDDGKLYISDGKKLWIYEKGDNQVDLYSVSAQMLPEEALAFLGGLGNLSAQFKVSSLNKKELQRIKATRNLDWLSLIPKNPKSNLEELILGFDSSTHLVIEAYLKNETGNLSHYHFKNVQLNQSIPDAKFVFVKPKGVREIRNQ